MTAKGQKSKPATGWFGRSPRKLDSGDREKQEEFLEDLAESATDRELTRLAKALSKPDPLTGFLAAVAVLSPFLRAIALRRPEILDALYDKPVAARLEAINAQMRSIGIDPQISESDLMRELRLLKAEAHFLIALDDLAGGLPAGETVERLSDLAAAAINSAIDFLLADAGRSNKLEIKDPKSPGLESGLIVLAMGKLGAGELNYSSDIDLVIFYDPASKAISANPDPEEFFPRMMRRLIRILQDRTSDGYVFRTDLRLRPDPGSTPLAIPYGAALHYYESRGLNWERAAFIKASPIAGDLVAGRAFMSELTPFVWRKYLDYASIAEVHSIKRQIYEHKGHGTVAVKGHNIKLGRGGIREIEFFVQTQQLIAGGRFPSLRGKQTVAMIAELSRKGWIDAEAAGAMTGCYWYLRDVENRLQMIADEQTHELPDNDEDLSVIARLMGEDSAEDFANQFRTVLETVERHYAGLFESIPKPEQQSGDLIFTAEKEDAGTLETLSGLGFERPSDMARIVRGWHTGRYRATQSQIAREQLAALTPSLLAVLGKSGRADDALIRFDAFLSGLPAGVQLFSLLRSNPSLLELMVTIMSAAPRLAETITRRPHVFDGLLDPGLMSELPDRDYLEDRMKVMLAETAVYEDVLDRLRIFAAEQRFLIGIRLMTGAIHGETAAQAFSDLADLVLERIFSAVREEFAVRHGVVPGATAAILGMGKLGSRELTAGSDIDLILLYDHNDDAEASDGEKPLSPPYYFARLTQRLIAAVSAPTAEGTLYEIDMRLRPSGNQGPVATRFAAFSKYQREDAWTWEHMALTRARPVAGDLELCERASSEIAAILSGVADEKKVRSDAAEMRATISKEKPPHNEWDVKLIKGGQIDIEFIAQTAVLTGNSESEGAGCRTIDILTSLTGKFGEPQIRQDLVDAWALYTQFAQLTRLCLEEPFDDETAPPGLSEILLRQFGEPDLGVLKARIAEMADRVSVHFSSLIGGDEPAGTL